MHFGQAQILLRGDDRFRRDNVVHDIECRECLRLDQLAGQRHVLDHAADEFAQDGFLRPVFGDGVFHHLMQRRARRRVDIPRFFRYALRFVDRRIAQETQFRS